MSKKTDNRPRNQRPRSRGGQRRTVDLAVAERQQQSVRALQEALQPELGAITGDRGQVVERVRARATELALERRAGDVGPVVEAALDEIFGLGPLEPLLRDRAVRRIRVEGAALYADGERVVWGFRDEDHARSLIDRILRAVGQDLAASPGGVSATMVDGSTLRARLDGPGLRVDIARP
jgi:hypothetical protein